MLGWVFPVPLYKGRDPRISDGFGSSRDGGSRKHAGVDVMFKRLAAEPVGLPNGTKNYYMPNDVPALAAYDGKIEKSAFIGTGGWVTINHGDGIKTNYAHLTKLFKKPGDIVARGDAIGLIGDNPKASDPKHLHFEYVKNGVKIDPEGLMMLWQKTRTPLLWTVSTFIVLGGLGYLTYRYFLRKRA